VCLICLSIDQETEGSNGTSIWLLGILSSSGLFGNSPDGDTDYLIHVQVVGTPEAFAGRTIMLENQVLGPRRQRIIGDRLVNELEATVTLCTHDREKFLGHSVLIRVLEGQEVVSEQRIHRIACKHSPTEVGNTEYNTIYLELDGSIDAAFGDSANVDASCTEPNYGVNCINDPDF